MGPRKRDDVTSTQLLAVVILSQTMTGTLISAFASNKVRSYPRNLRAPTISLFMPQLEDCIKNIR